MYLISPHKKQHKANLHCHSTVSDGQLTPEQLKELYRGYGYDILAITDHESAKSHCELSDPEFLMLTGYECYIRPTENCKYDSYLPEIHLNLFARDPKNETMICYNPSCCKYLDISLHDSLKKAGSQRPREYSRAYINEYIRTAQENGYIVAYNHPAWSMETEEDILACEGCFSLEMCNYGSWLSNRLEYNGVLYDKMLRAGKRVFCHSGDDNHNKAPESDPEWDSGGAFTMILSDELTYDSVFRALETGEMYSSMGPVFKEVSIVGDQLHVECSEVASIHVFTGGKKTVRKYAAKGEALTGADFTIDERALYVRVSIADREGRVADTRGYFRDELGLPPLN
ncbi:MAG: hypothetical protein IJZ85_01930 [Lachnospiraceae bacterium]|nr:hypothetical protein [Lachnospiraceae bacterium]